MVSLSQGTFARFSVLLISTLMLAACGDGYESYRSDKVMPYGGERTAGSTIIYVRKKMMPERSLNVEPQGEKAVMSPVVSDEMAGSTEHIDTQVGETAMDRAFQSRQRK